MTFRKRQHSFDEVRNARISTSSKWKRIKWNAVKKIVNKKILKMTDNSTFSSEKSSLMKGFIIWTHRHELSINLIFISSPPTTRHDKIMSSPSWVGPIFVLFSCLPHLSNTTGCSGKTVRKKVIYDKCHFSFLKMGKKFISGSRKNFHQFSFSLFSVRN